MIKHKNITLYKKYNLLYILMILFILSFALNSFKNTGVGDESIKINLKWNKAYPKQEWEDVKKGMLWSFSYLGATLPKGNFDKSISFIDSTTFELNINQLGFNANAIDAFNVICDSIKSTMSYKKNKHIDLSRFLVLTMHSSWHYYKITGVFNTLQEFEKNYTFKNAKLYGVTKSTVAYHDRLIKFVSAKDIFKSAFIAVEGSGSLEKGEFIPEAYEVFDFMPNGQLRFAVYNKYGQLIPASPKTHGEAGKPSKCIWCHELVIQPMVNNNNIPVAKMLSNEEFEKERYFLQNKLDDYRKILKSDIDYSKKQDHTYLELLYISFMEPNKERISNEFSEIGEQQLKVISEMHSHVYDEFPFIGDKLYHRYYIDSLFSINDLKVPLSVREEAGLEVNYFKN